MMEIRSAKMDNKNVIAYVISRGGNIMTTVNVTEARANLYKLIDDTSESHEPIVITGKRGNAVLLAEGDWNAINETLYLISIPGMRESIIEAMKEPLKGTSTELEW